MSRALRFLAAFAAGVLVGWLIAPRGDAPLPESPPELAQEADPGTRPEPLVNEADPDLDLLPHPVSLGGRPLQPTAAPGPSRADFVPHHAFVEIEKQRSNC